jgi:hypothetical protein
MGHGELVRGATARTVAGPVPRWPAGTDGYRPEPPAAGKHLSGEHPGTQQPTSHHNQTNTLRFSWRRTQGERAISSLTHTAPPLPEPDYHTGKGLSWSPHHHTTTITTRGAVKKLGEMRSKGLLPPLISPPPPGRSLPPRRATGGRHNILRSTKQKGCFHDHHTNETSHKPQGII